MGVVGLGVWAEAAATRAERSSRFFIRRSKESAGTGASIMRLRCELGNPEHGAELIPKTSSTSLPLGAPHRVVVSRFRYCAGRIPLKERELPLKCLSQHFVMSWQTCDR